MNESIGSDEIVEGLNLVMVKQKQILGILGMCLAVGGGITWFYDKYLISAFLWAIAGIILLKLNKTRNRSKKRR